MKSPNAAVLSPTALVRRAEKMSGSAGSRCRTIDFCDDAHQIRGRRDVDYATSNALISLKVTHRISVQLAVAKS